MRSRNKTPRLTLCATVTRPPSEIAPTLGGIGVSDGAVGIQALRYPYTTIVVPMIPGGYLSCCSVFHLRERWCSFETIVCKSFRSRKIAELPVPQLQSNQREDFGRRCSRHRRFLQQRLNRVAFEVPPLQGSAIAKEVPHRLTQVLA